MSANGDSTRDWLLKKLLKASRNLAEQGEEIKKLKDQRDTVSREALRLANARDKTEEQLNDATFEIQQLKRVPPIAPNLTVIYYTARGTSYPCAVDAVQSANGATTIHVRRPRG